MHCHTSVRHSAGISPGLLVLVAGGTDWVDLLDSWLRSSSELVNSSCILRISSSAELSQAGSSRRPPEMMKVNVQSPPHYRNSLKGFARPKALPGKVVVTMTSLRK